jgi:hypothetical protein
MNTHQARSFTINHRSSRGPHFASIQHGLSQGEGPLEVCSPNGSLPLGLAAGVPYWAIVLGPDGFQLALSPKNAAEGVQVVITTPGTGYFLVGPA